MNTHAIQPIQHTHQGEDKKKFQLELNMYFGKLMRLTTNTHLKIIKDTMHQCVVVSVAPMKTMFFLVDELDEGATPMHQLQQRKGFASARFHHEVHAHHHERPSLASTQHLHHHKHVKRVGLIIAYRVSVMSFKACSSHVVSHKYMCIVMLSHVKCKSSINSWM